MPSNHFLRADVVRVVVLIDREHDLIGDVENHLLDVGQPQMLSKRRRRPAKPGGCNSKNATRTSPPPAPTGN